MEKDIKVVDPFLYPALQLAYMGDAVYEQIIRYKAVTKGIRNVHSLHKECSNIAKASTQAKLGKIILDILDEREKAVYKRGRNSKPHSIPKNANISDYNNATAFEAVIGYLYLQGENNRLNYIINYALEKYHEVIK